MCNLTTPRLPPEPCNCRDVLSTANLLSLPRRVAPREPAAAPYTEHGETGLSLPGRFVNPLVLIGPSGFQEQMLKPSAELRSPPWPVLVKLCLLQASLCVPDRCGPPWAQEPSPGGQGSSTHCLQAGAITWLCGLRTLLEQPSSHVFLALIRLRMV